MERPSTARDTSESPARNGYAVTPHDTNEIGTYEPKALYVGTGGTIKIVLVGDPDASVLTFTNVPNGTLLPIRPRIIQSTGTTASGMIALY